MMRNWSLDNTWIFWFDLLEKYTKCNLTYQSDKLVGIAGISKRMHTTDLGEYLAGFWRTELEQQLLWLSEKPSANREEDLSTMIYRAPSFSWAAVNNPVSFFLCRSMKDSWDCRAEVLRVNLERPKSMLELVQGGFLRIRGKVKELILDKGIVPGYLYMQPTARDSRTKTLGLEKWSINGSTFTKSQPTNSDVTATGDSPLLSLTVDRVEPE